MLNANQCIKGTSSPFATFSFIKNPYKFAQDTFNKYGDLRWFKLNNKKIYIVSNNNIIHSLQHIKCKFFEPDEIYKSLGNNSLLLNDSNHFLLKRSFIRAVSKVNHKIIDEVLEINKKKYTAQKVCNGKALIDQILFDVLSALFTSVSTTPTFLQTYFEQCLKNLTAPIMFLPFLKINFPFTKWNNFLNAKFELIREIRKLKHVDGSFPFLLKEGLLDDEIIDNSFLFLFAGFDNPAFTIANIFTSDLKDINYNLDAKPPTPFIVKTICEPFETNNIAFETGSHFAIDLINWRSSNKAFGFGDKRCPGKNLSYAIIIKILGFLNKHFKLKNTSIIKYSRCRFAYGPTYFEIEKK